MRVCACVCACVCVRVCVHVCVCVCEGKLGGRSVTFREVVLFLEVLEERLSSSWRY